jgi:cystathionine beta-lyase
MSFDEDINRIGTHSSKWDTMEHRYGVSPNDGLAMWVADMDFRPPHAVQRALENMTSHGIYGYFGDNRDYLNAIIWWMQNRHDWQVDSDAIFTTHGLVNGAAVCIDAFTASGDGVILMTPVYHAFAQVIRAADRQLVECKMAQVADRYLLDITTWDAQMTGQEKMFILCSPHNPGGRVWTEDELLAIADFCERHNLILISDEIHHDVVMPGFRHIAMPLAAPHVTDRLIMMTAGSKTFNIAGGHTGNVIIPNPKLRQVFAKRLNALGISTNAFGVHMVTAAYSPEGARWVDELCAYIEGVSSMRLEGTYLAWVNFSGTGMTETELKHRIHGQAKIAVSHGISFGAGGETFMRFNLGMPRAKIEIAIHRLQAAFRDLQ